MAIVDEPPVQFYDVRRFRLANYRIAWLPQEDEKTSRLSFGACSLIFIGGANAQSVMRNPPTQDDTAQTADCGQSARLDLKSIVTNQPDFVADEVIFYGEGFGGFSAKRHVARRGTSLLHRHRIRENHN